MSRSFNVRMDDKLVDGLDAAALEIGATRSDLIRAFCEEGLKSHRAYMDSQRRDKEARAYLADFLIEKGIAKPHQIDGDAFWFGASPALWLRKVERTLGPDVAEEVAAKMAEIMGKSDELAAYLAED